MTGKFAINLFRTSRQKYQFGTTKICTILIIIVTATNVKKVKLFLLTPLKHRRVGGRGVAPLILKPGTCWRSVVSLKPQPLYPRGRTQVRIE
jgi:hypothetical protein